MFNLLKRSQTSLLDEPSHGSIHLATCGVITNATSWWGETNWDNNPSRFWDIMYGPGRLHVSSQMSNSTRYMHAGFSVKTEDGKLPPLPSYIQCLSLSYYGIKGQARPTNSSQNTHKFLSIWRVILMIKMKGRDILCIYLIATKSGKYFHFPV